MDKVPIQIDQATLPFFQVGTAEPVIEFDSTGCRCPVPMINAMAGLAWIAHHGGKLVMHNGFEPQGLYERVEGYFQWAVASTAEGVRVTFTPVSGRAQQLDFSNNGCRGGEGADAADG